MIDRQTKWEEDSQFVMRERAVDKVISARVGESRDIGVAWGLQGDQLSDQDRLESIDQAGWFARSIAMRKWCERREEATKVTKGENRQRLSGFCIQRCLAYLIRLPLKSKVIMCMRGIR